MAIVNAFTQQRPITTLGNTGAQLLKMIAASRVFIKNAESVLAAPYLNYTQASFKTNGVAPNGWTDLGVMDAPAKITYNKPLTKVETGLDKVVRDMYSVGKSATLEFSLTQVDDIMLTNTGFNGSVITAGSSMNFLVGQEDVVRKALLCVYCNKLDGKEMHFYHPSAALTVNFETAGDAIVAKCTADLLAFTPIGQTVDALYSATVFSA